MNDEWYVSRSGFKYEKSVDANTNYTIQGDVYAGKLNHLLLPYQEEELRDCRR